MATRGCLLSFSTWLIFKGGEGGGLSDIPGKGYSSSPALSILAKPGERVWRKKGHKLPSSGGGGWEALSTNVGRPAYKIFSQKEEGKEKEKAVKAREVLKKLKERAPSRTNKKMTEIRKRFFFKGLSPLATPILFLYRSF
jgi:hypothetical protein